MKTTILVFMVIGCSGGTFSSGTLTDAGSFDETGGANDIPLDMGGSSALSTGGNSALGTGGSSALGTGGNNTLATGGSSALATGGSSALGTGGSSALGTGGSSQCMPQATTVCTYENQTVTVTAQHDYIAIQCKDNTFWCKGSACTMATADDKALLCVKGSCQFNLVCVTTNTCSTVVTSTNLTCGCSSTGNVACA
jgi:hypothetical protein